MDLLIYFYFGIGSDIIGIYSIFNRIKGLLGKFILLNNFIIWYVDIGYIFFLFKVFVIFSFVKMNLSFVLIIKGEIILFLL